MDKIDNSKIHSLTQYVEFVEKIPKQFSVSRGHGKSSYMLLPGALRLDEDGNRKHSKRSIIQFMDMFMVNSHNYLKTPWDIENDIEWMAMAQHYGLPTRLLDFTDSHIISLLFAVEDAFENSDEDADVWFLDPVKLNDKNAKMSKYINIKKNTDCCSLDRYDGPVAIKCRRINSRMNAQSGLFVYFSDGDKCLDTYNDNDILLKATIAKEDKKSILASLYMMGINKKSIYPELESVAKDILVNYDINTFMEENE